MRRQINAKTPGTLLCRYKEVKESIDSKFEAINELPSVPVHKQKEEVKEECIKAE